MTFLNVPKCQSAGAGSFLLAFVIGMAVLPTASADPNVDASKTDALTNDVDGDGEADPGDTITYTVRITNTGDMDATGAAFSDAIDANTTLVPGSVKTEPIAVHDDYSATGNVQISVSAPGVLSNDTDPDGGAITAIAIVGGSSLNGGDVDLAGNYIIPNLGAVNGLSGPDFQFEADVASTFFEREGAVPEPATALLGLMSLGALGLIRRRIA